MPVVMEESMTDTAAWDGVLCMVLGNHLYCKLTSDIDADFVCAVAKIAESVDKMLQKALPNGLRTAGQDMAGSGEGSPTRQKKTKRADDQGLSLKLPGLTPPQVVKQICTEGTALKWDDAAGCYHVLDGDEFERRFDQLRSKHERGEGAQTAKRIFSTMSRYYTILPGSPGYAKTGVVFTGPFIKKFPCNHIINK